VSAVKTITWAPVVRAVRAMAARGMRGSKRRAQNQARRAPLPPRLPAAASRSSSARLQRLSPLDVSNLRAEEHGVPMHVAALARVEGAPLCDASGGLQLEKVRAVVEGRLDLAPRLRQVLVRPRVGLGRPVWADDACFSIAQHVRTRPVPAPGDEAALLAVCAQLNEPPLDRSRPLWELWLLPGLADGTTAPGGATVAASACSQPLADIH
jgi:wax ester synthase-like acyl-CoA acyltransferase family protein